jgi:hypothetical protein
MEKTKKERRTANLSKSWILDFLEKQVFEK